VHTIAAASEGDRISVLIEALFGDGGAVSTNLRLAEVSGVP
jgi:hypothetical protein